MPRRKGQGISPTKRTTHNKDELQWKRKAGDNNEDPGGGGVGDGDGGGVMCTGVGAGDGVQTDDSYSSSNTSKSTDTTSSSCDLSNSKYLHKKFKKMATSSPIAAPLQGVTADDTVVNGVAFGLAAADESVTTVSKMSDALKTVSVTEELKGKVEIESGSSPRATSRGASPSMLATTSAVPSATVSLSSSSSSPSSTSVPQQGRYVCQYCKLACAKPSVLQKHIRAHTNERPYPCTPCGFAFKTKSNLYKHCRSRAHALKMEEEGSSSGTKFNLPSAESSDIEDDEDENYSNSTPPLPSVSISSTRANITACGNNLSTSSSIHSYFTVTTKVTNTTTVSTISAISSTSETNNNQDKPRQIYKPKFHKAALYQEEEQQQAAAAAAAAEIEMTAKIKTVSNNPTTTPQSPATCTKTPSTCQVIPTSLQISSLKTSTSPMPEFLHQHINKIISDNQAIVETVDPHWSKKFLQCQSSREQLREGSPGSPLSPLSLPGTDIAAQWSKNLFHRQMSLNDPVMCGNSDSERVKLSLQQSAQSKLALALLRPSRHESASLSPHPSDSPLSVVLTTPEPSYQQPLNLSTTNNTSSNMNSDEPNSNLHRKRCFSEGFANTGTGRSHSMSLSAVLKDHNILGTANYNRAQSNAKLTRMDSTGTTISCIEGGQKNHHTNEKLLYHPQNPEGSIIKDLLLKARGVAAAGITPASGVYLTGMVDIISNIETSSSLQSSNMSYLQSSNNSEDDMYLSNSQYVCLLCKIPFRNAQNLEIHQRYYCKGEVCSKVMNSRSPQHSPNAAMKYATVLSHSLDIQPQLVGDDEDVHMGGRTIKGSGMQPLNVAKVSSKVGRQEFKSSPLTPPSRDSGKTPTIVVPPFPSPGPLLGNTPLVDSYHQISIQQQKKREDADNEEIMEDIHHRGPFVKRRRLDSELSRDTSSTTSSPDIRPLSTTPLSGIISPSTTTLRSLEELSKCPMRPNSLQMFGGEVQILDGAGETKTMRIEPSSRGGKSPGVPGGAADLILSLPNHLHPGGVLMSSASSKGGAAECDGEVVPGNVSPHVVTIARSGLHSGGTIVQVPQKSSNNSGTVTSGLVKPPRTSGGNINAMNAPSPKNVTSPLPKQQQKNVSGGGMILNSISQSTSPYCTGTLLTSNTNTVTNTFPDTTKLLVPIVPNITTPNLAVPGIPAPNLGHHLPFIPFAPFLPDGALLNPLTSITAYNPLTLPPHTGIIHQPHTLQTLSQPQAKDKKSPGAVSSSPIPRESNVPPPPYSGGVVTILHGGKAIPYVPGMPGPHTLLPTVPSQVTVRKEPSPKPLDLASPSRESQPFKITDQSKVSQQSASLLPKNLNVSGTPNISIASSVPSSHYLKDDHPRIASSKAPIGTLLKIPKTPSQLIPSIKVDIPVPATNHSADSTLATGEESTQHVSNSISSPVLKISKGTRPDTLPFSALKDIGNEKDDKLNKETGDGTAKKTEKANENTEEFKTKASINGSNPKFLRPTTLPLKPGTFVPKKHHGTGLTPTGTVLSLISPETPRPRKSYGQLYLNGHAYTYLGLKCSTRAFFCTLNRPQPMYVPQTPEHAKLSMYSNWKVCLEADPNPFGLDPGHAMAFYDSRHRPTTYSVAKPADNKPMVLTHSSYWLERNKVQQSENMKAVEKKSDTNTSSDKSHGDPGKDTDAKTEGIENSSTTGEPAPRRVKIFDGGFESNEEYIYVRGRGRGRYVCEECGIRCKKPSMLKKHIRTHTDVRPFTCKHCNFSFKTKGNLTKHMKSKAHYKKCMELGIVPVPTVVDDSYIDEECLIRQQALQASRCGDGETDSDENEEEEDDEDDDDEDEEEEQNQADGDDNNISKGKLEREAVCGLLSLSESTRVNSSSSHYVSAGLIPLSAHCGRPTTYPYSLTLPVPGPNSHGNSLNTPQTPTLTAVSAQTEREKVSRNTGLALELHNGGEGKLKEEGRASSMIRRRGNAAALVLIPPQTGDANRYYFPSCRTPTIPMAMFSKNVTGDRSSVDGESDSDSDEGAENDSSVRDSPLSERNTDDAETHSSTTVLQPMDLSNKTQMNTNIKKMSATLIPYIPPSLSANAATTPTTPISEILTPVSEPAILLASICSSVERFPVSSTMLSHKPPDPAETTMLQAYLTERALQDVRIKQHQFHHHGYITTTCTAVSSTSTTSMPMQEMTVITRSLSLQKPLVDKETGQKESVQGVAITVPRSAGEVLNAQVQNVESEKSSVQEPAEQVNGCKLQASSSDGEYDKNFTSCDRIKFKEGASLKTQTSTVGEKMNLVPMSSNNIVRNVVVGGIGFSGHQSASSPTSTSGTNVTKISSLTKPKAEFLPPSSGPSPSYVSMTEDGRSICVICNKIFSKPSQLRLHVNIHYFERPFRCESCAVSFRTKGHLQKHERSVSHQNKVSMNSTFGTPTTTNPRPFKCDDCKIAFRIHGHLAKHLRSKMHIMKLECVGKLPFGTYAEMEREGISLNEIDTTDCDNSLESLQVLAQKLYEKDPTKLGQWDGDRGEILTSHSLPQMSGGETSSDEGEPLLGCQSPLNIMSSNVQEMNVSDVGPHQDMMLRSNTGEVSFSKQDYQHEKKSDIGSMSREHRCKQDVKKEDALILSPPKPCISTESLKSSVHGNMEFITNCSNSKQLTSNCRPDTGDTAASGQNNGINKTEQNTRCPSAREFNQNESSKAEAMGQVSEVAGQLQSYEKERGQSNEEQFSARQREWQQPEEADYEDASDGDNDGGQSSMFSCSTCKLTFPNLGGLRVHVFVEHDSSTEMTEDPSQFTSSNTKTSDSTIVLTSKVPTLHNQKLNMPVPVSSDGISKVLTVNCLSQFRKRPSMTASGKEIQDSSFLGPFSKRPTPDRQDFKVSGSTNMPTMKNSDNLCTSERDKRSSLNSESDSLNLESRVTAASNSDLETQLTTSDGHQVALEEEIRRLECKSLTNMDIKVSESNKLSNMAEEVLNSEKDTGKQLPKKVMEDDMEVHVSLGQVMEACVTLNESDIKCQRLETDTSRAELEVQSSSESRQQQNVDESAKSDQSASRDKCESVDSRQLLTSEQQKGDTSAPEGHQTMLSCDLCGKVQSSQESLQKHLLSHAQARPFVCEFCDAGFISQQLLQSHLVIHQQKDELTTLQ